MRGLGQGGFGGYCREGYLLINNLVKKLDEETVCLIGFVPRKTNSKKAIKDKRVMPVLSATPRLSRLNVCYSNQQSLLM